MAKSAPRVSSSDLAFLCYAPQVLARAYHRANSGLGDSRDKLSWRLGLIDCIQRFLTAVLAQELIGLALERPKAYEDLLNKLETPTLGAWGKAAGALAERLLDSEQTLVAPQLAELLRVRGEGGKWQRTDFATHLEELVKLRNKVCHEDGQAFCDEGPARDHLEAIEEPLRSICQGLRVLRDHPVLYLKKKRELQDGRWELDLVRFVGQHPTRACIHAETEAKVPAECVFMVASSGDALLLSPFLVVETRLGQDQLRQLSRWESDPNKEGSARHFTYSLLDAGGREKLADPPETNSPDELRAAPGQAARRNSAMPEDLAEDLRRAAEERDAPYIPGYRLEGILGRGASSIVWLAQEELKERTPGPKIALKVLKEQVALDPGQRTRFKQEADTLGQLQDPGVVAALDYGGVEQGQPYIAMELVRGEDLQSWVDRKGPLPPKDAAKLVGDVLETLIRVHSKGVWHRDIKPSNVMVDSSGRTRLIDFGIATAEHLAKLTGSLEAIGTFAFAAPEQHETGSEVDARSDLYAVGRLLEFLAAGSLGLPGAISEGLPPGIHALVRKATQRNPTYRFQSASEMRAALDERASADWKGAPVQAGDRLNESFEVTELVGSIAELTIFRGTELESGDSVTIVLAVGEAGRQRLRDTLGQEKDFERQALEYRTLSRTLDGLSFAVLGAADAGQGIKTFVKLNMASPREAMGAMLKAVQTLPDQKQRDFFRAGRKAVREKLLPSKRVGLLRAKEVPYLRRLAEQTEALLKKQIPPTMLLVGVVGILEPLLTMLAMMIATDPRRAGRQKWIDRLLNARLSALPNWFEEHDPKREILARETVEALKRLYRLRNQVLHGGLRSIEKPAVVMKVSEQVLDELFDEAATLAADLLPESLEPFVQEYKKGHWAILQVRGSGLQYWDLSAPHTAGSSRLLPPLEGTVPALLKRFPRHAHLLPGVRRESEQDLLGWVKKEVLSWEFVSGVERERMVEFNGRRLMPDLLVRARRPGSAPGDELGLAVVEVKFSDFEVGVARFLDQLWTYAMACQVPFAALTNGRDWHWYRVNAETGLESLNNGLADVRGWLETPSGSPGHALSGPSPEFGTGERYRFWTQLLQAAKRRSELHSRQSPVGGNKVSVGSGVRGLKWIYTVRKCDSQVELYIERREPEENFAVLEQLLTHKESVESAFGGQLEWQRLKKTCRIAYRLDLGGWRDKEHWPVVIEATVDAMIRLEKALREKSKGLQYDGETGTKKSGLDGPPAFRQ